MIFNSKIYLSSLGFKGDEVANSRWYTDKKNIEFTSSGYSNSELGKKLFKEAKGACMIHNYFPGSFQEPFIMNIATLNKSLWKTIESHIKENIRLTSELSEPKFYGIHIGFKFELSIDEIGRKLNPQVDNEKKRYEVMISRLINLSEFANKLGVKLLIENNVIRKDSLYNNTSPLFGVTIEEVMSIIEDVSSEKIGWILDTAHLKVSYNSLNLKIKNDMKLIKFKPDVIHHSDNNGFVDSNDVPNENYWFFEYINKFPNSYHVIEVKDPDENKLNKFHSILNKHLSN